MIMLQKDYTKEMENKWHKRYALILIANAIYIILFYLLTTLFN